MSETVQLAATVRQGKVKDLKDVIQAVVYGSGETTTSLAVKRLDFERVYAKSGESGLVSLKLDDGRELPVIIKDLQTDAVKHRIIHVDFFKVNMNEKVVAEVSLNFVGEATAVKTNGAIIVEHLDQLHIECLPKDLLQKIDIDISVLKEIGDAIYVKDIKLPEGVVTTNDGEEIVVNAVEPKKAEEAPVVAAAETAPVAGAPAEGAAAEAKPEEKGKDKK